MAYDFHFNPDTQSLGLIEINTNASGFLFSELLAGPERPFWGAMESLENSFLAEMAGRPVQNIAIIDEDPPAQKMYMEFLMYRDFFARWGFKPEILDIKEPRFDERLKSLKNRRGEKIDFIYNRSTDFLFAAPGSQHLARAYFEGCTVISPHPREYLLLADKKRLTELSRQGRLEELGPEVAEPIGKVLLPALKISDFKDPEEIWALRREYFFKPQRSFGTKSTYRGTTLTRKVFDQLLTKDTLVQRYLPAPKIELVAAGQRRSWKYDLRFFAYRDEIQWAAARLYQGQVTNFKTDLGGYAPVILDQ